MIDLLKIQPHKVSRDLSGYITYMYGPTKIGKTTFGSQMPHALLLAFEKGYNALPNVYPQDVTSWAQMKIVLRELKKEEVKKTFQSIIVDTIDVAATMCEKYVISQAGVDALNQIPYGQGWVKVKRELEDTFRSITQMGYAVLFISHDKDATFTKQNGVQYNKVVPTVGTSYNEIIKNMVDIYCYAHTIIKDEKPKRVLTLRSYDGTIDCGSRFRYIAPEVDLSYDALVKALNDAIDEEARYSGHEFITEERNAEPVGEELNFDKLMQEFGEMVNSIPKEKMEYYAPRITEITDKYLGKGKKVSSATRDQVEQIALIVFDLKDLLVKED